MMEKRSATADNHQFKSIVCGLWSPASNIEQALNVPHIFLRLSSHPHEKIEKERKKHQQIDDRQKTKI